MPDPVEPDGHVVLLDLEHHGQFFDRQPFHVTEQEEARILGVHGGDRAPEPLFQQRRGLRGGGVRRETASEIALGYDPALALARGHQEDLHWSVEPLADVPIRQGGNLANSSRSPRECGTRNPCRNRDGD